MDKNLAKVEFTPEILLEIDKADRSKWDSETYISMGIEISQIKGFSQWLLGKLAFEYSEDKRYGAVTEYAKQIRQNPRSVEAYKLVYEKFHSIDPSFVPTGYVPWGVMQMAAGTDDPIQTLNELHDGSATKIEEAYRHIKTKISGKNVPPKPRLKLKFDEISGHWKIIIEPEDIAKIDWSDVQQQLLDYFKTII